jgi:hypothetical protein
MNLQGDRVFSPINSIVGRSVAGDTRRSTYTGNAGFQAARAAAGHLGAGAPQAQNACFRERLQLLAVTAQLLPNPEGRNEFAADLQGQVAGLPSPARKRRT